MTAPQTPLDKALDELGWAAMAVACGVTKQAVRKWLDAGRLPRSEFSGETDYAGIIERALGDGSVTKEQLLDWSRQGWNTSNAA